MTWMFTVTVWFACADNLQAARLQKHLRPVAKVSQRGTSSLPKPNGGFGL